MLVSYNKPKNLRNAQVHYKLQIEIKLVNRSNVKGIFKICNYWKLRHWHPMFFMIHISSLPWWLTKQEVYGPHHSPNNWCSYVNHYILIVAPYSLVTPNTGSALFKKKQTSYILSNYTFVCKMLNSSCVLVWGPCCDQILVNITGLGLGLLW